MKFTLSLVMFIFLVVVFSQTSYAKAEYIPPSYNVTDLRVSANGLTARTTEGNVPIDFNFNINRNLITRTIINQSADGGGFKFTFSAPSITLPSGSRLINITLNMPRDADVDCYEYDEAVEEPDRRGKKLYRRNYCIPIIRMRGITFDFQDFDECLSNFTMRRTTARKIEVVINLTQRDLPLYCDPAVFQNGVINITGTPNNLSTVFADIGNPAIFNYNPVNNLGRYFANITIWGNFTCNNCSLQHGGTTAGRFSIFVMPNGTFTVFNRSSLTWSPAQLRRWNLVAYEHSNITIINSQVDRIGTSNTVFDLFGLAIHTRKAIIENVTMYDARNGIAFGLGSQGAIARNVNIINGSNNGYGIYTTKTNDTIFQNISVYNFTIGGYIHSASNRNNITNLSVFANSGTTDGIIILGVNDIVGGSTSGNRIENSTVHGNNQSDRCVDISGGSGASGNIILRGRYYNCTGGATREGFGIRDNGITTNITEATIHDISGNGNLETGYGIYSSDDSATGTQSSRNKFYGNNNIFSIGGLNSGSGYGILITSTNKPNNTRIFNNTINKIGRGTSIGSSYCIYLVTTDNMTIEYNSLSNCSYGGILHGNDQRTILSQNILATSDAGLIGKAFNLTDFNNIYRDLADASDLGAGLQISGKDNVHYGNLYQNNEAGIRTMENGSVFYNITFFSNNVDIDLYDGAGNNKFYNMTTNADVTDVAYDYAEDYCEFAGNNTFVNVTYNSLSFCGSFIIGGWHPALFVWWYLDAYVNGSDGINLSGVNVSVYNASSQFMFTKFTNANGRTNQTEVLEKYINRTGTLLLGYNMSANATYSTVMLNQSFNMTGNKTITFTFTITKAFVFGIIALLVFLYVATLSIKLNDIVVQYLIIGIVMFIFFMMLSMQGVAGFFTPLEKYALMFLMFGIIIFAVGLDLALGGRLRK